MVEAMLGGWRAQQLARGLRESTIAPRERLVRQFLAFTSEYPWQWGPAHVDEWVQSLTGERHLAASTIRNYQTELRLFTCVPQLIGCPGVLSMRTRRSGA